MTKTNTPKNPNIRVFKASTILQSRAGTGLLSADKIQDAEATIRNQTTDFTSAAKNILAGIDRLLTQFSDDRPEVSRQILADLIDPFMDIKANAGMFGYPVASRLAAIILSFLETIETIDHDVMDILQIHQNTLHQIFNNRLIGSGGVHGDSLETELRAACNRYLARHSYDPLPDNPAAPSDF